MISPPGLETVNRHKELEPDNGVPSFLYKYRSFGPYLLKELCDSEIFYASPDSFNDPLDSRATIENDLPLHKLESLVLSLAKFPEQSEKAVRLLQQHRYNATEDQANYDSMYLRGLMQEVEIRLRRNFGGRGVLSLAERWDCPLMWSHYGAQHGGICLEYSTADHVCELLDKVSYGGRRALTTSDLYAWKVDGSSDALDRVRTTNFFTKAKPWEYEREWRDLTERFGAASVRFDLSAVIFGARCDHAVKTSIVKLLHDKIPAPVFYDVQFSESSFELCRQTIDIDEYLVSALRPSAAIVFGRHPVTTLPPGASPLPAHEPWSD